MEDMPTLSSAVEFAQRHETPWPRDPHAVPAPGQQPFGVHHDDPVPYHRLRGPVHARGGPSGVVWQRGRELAAWGDPERADLTFSVAKSYLAMLAGLAQREGLLPNLHEPVRLRTPNIGFEGAHNDAITWAHLLTQTSEWQGTCFGLPDQAEHHRHVSMDPRPPSGRKGELRALQPPGTYWEYNDVRINQLSLALLHLFERPLPDVFGSLLMGPLGATSRWTWLPYDDAWVVLRGQRMPSVPGGTHWGGGVSIGARDQARLAHLLLAGGQFADSQLLSAEWVRFMATPCSVAPFYGGLVWLNTARRLFAAASEQAYAMMGAGGHLVLIEPACQAVVVARWLRPEATAQFVALVLAALTTRPATSALA